MPVGAFIDSDIEIYNILMESLQGLNARGGFY